MFCTDIDLTRTFKQFYSIILLLMNNNCVHCKNILLKVILSQMIKPCRWVFLAIICSVVLLIFFLRLCLCSDHHQWRHHVDPVRFWAAVLSHQGGERLQLVVLFLKWAFSCWVSLWQPPYNAWKYQIMHKKIQLTGALMSSSHNNHIWLNNTLHMTSAYDKSHSLICP